MTTKIVLIVVLFNKNDRPYLLNKCNGIALSYVPRHTIRLFNQIVIIL